MILAVPEDLRASRALGMMWFLIERGNTVLIQ